MRLFAVIWLSAAVAAPAIMAATLQLEMWPCADELAELDITYQQRIDDILVHSADSSEWLRIVVLPSFHPEWVVAVSPQRAMLEYRVAERQLWQANWVATIDADGIERRKWSDVAVEVPISTRSASLSGVTVKALVTLWNEVLARIDPTKDTGLDGTTYQLSSSSSGRCAEAWSPEPGTVAGEIVGISDTLRALAVSETPEERVGLERKLHEEAKETLFMLRGNAGR